MCVLLHLQDLLVFIASGRDALAADLKQSGVPFNASLPRLSLLDLVVEREASLYSAAAAAGDGAPAVPRTNAVCLRRRLAEAGADVAALAGPPPARGAPEGAADGTADANANGSAAAAVDRAKAAVAYFLDAYSRFSYLPDVDILSFMDKPAAELAALLRERNIAVDAAAMSRAQLLDAVLASEDAAFARTAAAELSEPQARAFWPKDNAAATAVSILPRERADTRFVWIRC